MTSLNRGAVERVRPVQLAPLIAAVRTSIVRQLLPWFRRHARALPWRRRRTPYRVLVSELMLQQTRADQAAPYFERFIRRFPDWRALAAADEADVLKAWEGLGYYARARNLRRLAQWIVNKGGGRLPKSVDALRRLPGIGPYTAAAVGSLAFGLDAAAVDGNVRRVLARVFELSAPRGVSLEAECRRLAADLLPKGRAGAFNEAMMELGAVVCLPRAPRCTDCPLRGVCRSAATGTPEQYPRRAPRKRVPHYVVGAAVTLDARGRALIAQRKSEEMLGGLWEFPGGKIEPGETMAECIARELKEELGIEIEVGERLTVVRHAYSHFTIELHAHFARRIRGRPRRIHCADFAWVPVARLRDRPFSRADLRIIEALEAWVAAARSHPRGRASNISDTSDRPQTSPVTVSAT